MYTVLRQNNETLVSLCNPRQSWSPMVIMRVAVWQNWVMSYSLPEKIEGCWRYIIQKVYKKISINIYTHEDVFILSLAVISMTFTMTMSQMAAIDGRHSYCNTLCAQK